MMIICTDSIILTIYYYFIMFFLSLWTFFVCVCRKSYIHMLLVCLNIMLLLYFFCHINFWVVAYKLLTFFLLSCSHHDVVPSAYIKGSLKNFLLFMIITSLYILSKYRRRVVSVCGERTHTESNKIIIFGWLDSAKPNNITKSVVNIYLLYSFVMMVSELFSFRL